MAASSEEWSVNSNDVVEVSLVQPSTNGLQTTTEFHPTFTYPIFGEAEQIFGYKGLEIDLRFAAHDLRPNVQISYDRKFHAIGDTSALDLLGTLKQYLPPVAFQPDFDSFLQNDNKSIDWKPPGQHISSYTRGGEAYEIWAGSLSDPAVRTLVDNIQILILFFIEGGQYINLDDFEWTLDRWRVYFVYHISTSRTTLNASPYSFVGYSTTYRFYRFPVPKPAPDDNVLLEPLPPREPLKPSSLSSRLRISQFLILPKYQRGGHGSALYQAIYSEAMQDPTIVELTVEDPSEEFDKLRDINDFRTLEPQLKKADVKINSEPFLKTERGRVKRLPTSTLLPTTMLKEIRRKNKIAGRQFARQVEMFLLATIGFSHRQAGGASLTAIKVKGPRAIDVNDRNYYWWRLLVKQRILKKNKDQLVQIPLEDRIPAIEDSLRGQEDEYEGMLLAFALNQNKEKEGNGNGVADAGEPSSSASRKRKVVEDDEEEEDMVLDAAKKARV